MIKGYIYALIYILLMAISNVWVEQLGNIFSVSFLLLITSLIAILFFNALTLKNFRYNHKIIFLYPRLFFIISIMVLLMWGLMYYAVIYSSARYALILAYAFSAISGGIAQRKYIPVSVSLCFVAYAIWAAPEASVLPTIAGATVGIASYIYSKASHRIFELTKMKIFDLLAIRYYLLVFISLLLVIYSVVIHQPWTTQPISLDKIIVTLGTLSFIGLIIPNFLSLKVIKELGAELYSIVISFTPVLTFILQGLVKHDWSLKMLIASLSLSLIMNVNLLANYVKLKKIF